MAIMLWLTLIFKIVAYSLGIFVGIMLIFYQATYNDVSLYIIGALAAICFVLLLFILTQTTKYYTIIANLLLRTKTFKSMNTDYLADLILILEDEFWKGEELEYQENEDGFTLTFKDWEQ